MDSFLEQSYALDFDDIAGGMPTRFRYRQVASNDFGLTAEEVRHDNHNVNHNMTRVKVMITIIIIIIEQILIL